MKIKIFKRIWSRKLTIFYWSIERSSSKYHLTLDWKINVSKYREKKHRIRTKVPVLT